MGRAGPREEFFAMFVWPRFKRLKKEVEKEEKIGSMLKDGRRDFIVSSCVSHAQALRQRGSCIINLAT